MVDSDADHTNVGRTMLTFNAADDDTDGDTDDDTDDDTDTDDEIAVATADDDDGADDDCALTVTGADDDDDDVMVWSDDVGVLSVA